jgi:aminoglycoside phosphotransferase (APT) family kinase protein
MTIGRPPEDERARSRATEGAGEMAIAATDGAVVSSATPPADGGLGHELLEAVRAASGQPIAGYAEPPRAVTGGRDTATYFLRLDGAGGEWAAPLVLRLFPSGALALGRARREGALQSAVADQDYPAPRPLLVGDVERIQEAPFLLMERLPGERMAEQLWRRPLAYAEALAEAQVRLHGLDVARLEASLREAGPDAAPAGLDADLQRMRDLAQRPGLEGIAIGLRWLDAHRRTPGPRVLCHGDLHPMNVLVQGREVTGVVDWANARLADAAYDVAQTRILLALAPLSTPRVLRLPVQALRLLVMRRYTAAYRRRRRIDEDRLQYNEAFATLSRYSEALHALQYPAERRSGWASWDAVRRTSAHFAALTGHPLPVPAPRADADAAGG